VSKVTGGTGSLQLRFAWGYSPTLKCCSLPETLTLFTIKKAAVFSYPGLLPIDTLVMTISAGTDIHNHHLGRTLVDMVLWIMMKLKTTFQMSNQNDRNRCPIYDQACYKTAPFGPHIPIAGFHMTSLKSNYKTIDHPDI